jgi:hypothetical protein
MILLWGPPDDTPLTAVHEALDERGADLLVLDHPQLSSSRMVRGCDGLGLKTPDRTYQLSEITACYPRPYGGARPSPSTVTHPSVVRHLERMEFGLWLWAATTRATVLNRPTPSATNSTKTTQTRAAEQCGLHVPPTLVTTDIGYLRQFADSWGQVIAKGVGGARTVVAQVDVEGTDRLPHLATCPTYFQAYLAGTNHRLHVVGDQVFAVSITTNNVDYRYGGCEMAPAVIPDDIVDKCRLVCARLGLVLAGIDLIHGDDGEWYFLEANPSPAFTFFTGFDRVASAIADLLIAAPHA